MNGEVCCILGVCCPAGSDGQVNALAVELVKDGICSENPDASRVAAWVLKHFDLAEKGTLDALRASYVKHAQHAK